MHRRPMRGLLAGAAVAALALAAACGEKSTGSSDETGSNAASALSIQPVVEIDPEGVPAEGAGEAAEAADPAGDGSATCPAGTKIGFAGALSGGAAALGINIRNGIKVALKEHNDANAGCQVELAEFDTEGDPTKATQVAPSIVQDAGIIGLVGPAFSGETGATGDVFSQAGLVSVTASATNPDLTKNGWKTFFRGLANDAVQGPAVAKYLLNELKLEKICVVQDDTDYGKGLATEVKATLGDAVACEDDVKTGQKDFSATLTKIEGAAPDAVFYAGYYPEAAPFASQLRDKGIEATFISADGTNDPQFVDQAGDAAEGSVLSCPCGPAPDSYATAYEEVNNAAPGVYSVEAYDLATILLKGIDAGNQDRASLLQFVSTYDGQGLARHYKWDPTGELESTKIWIYKVEAEK